MRPTGFRNELMDLRGRLGRSGCAALWLFAYSVPAYSDTIEAALVRAYQNNPQLNAQRASVRSTDENVPQALSGYRPRVSLSVNAGEQYTDVQSKTVVGTTLSRSTIHGFDPPRTFSGSLSQPKARSQPPGKHCAFSNNLCCWLRPRSTWTT
jgi:outer membrane protein